MMTIEAFSLYIMICVLAPLIGAFTLLFLFVFEKRIDLVEKEKNEIALENELQKAQYNQLTQEIQPHFFFNTMNSILSLARLERKQELIHSIETFSKILKHKYKTNTTFITLDEELSYITAYLDIQKIRFRERLDYEIIADDTVRKAIILPFLLQTLVENAFKHSFDKKAGKADLKIQVEQHENTLSINVINSLPNEEEHTAAGTGIGLSNITKRLNILFPNDEKSVGIKHSSEYTTVTVTFPLVFKNELKE
ncbi:sensor histidine kinase [Planomicrobium sp. YIM 101495]|uniref:sensor histidine kinase n=1 Tax=Planomicrobium sp. YIM 101495 TaxID=2665160 RepID=UPI0012B83137|nr:histidine kinase [Planomicrobium sp. YIM 101495]MTD30653.1 histidine kinase [Planomicrobium sp. YIM 101495]